MDLFYNLALHVSHRYLFTLALPECWENKHADQTLEVLMSDLDPAIMDQFYMKDGVSASDVTRVSRFCLSIIDQICWGEGGSQADGFRLLYLACRRSRLQSEVKKERGKCWNRHWLKIIRQIIYRLLILPNQALGG